MPMYREVNKEFFNKWTNEMAYILGFFAADGNMQKTKRGTHFIAFYSADRDILESIQRVMASAHKLSERKSRSGAVYRFQIGSYEMYQDLRHLGFSDGKARQLGLPRIPQRYFSHFVRGYFDGDGNVWIGTINKNRKIPSRVLQAAFTSGSRKFLSALWLGLRKNGLMGGALYTSQKKNFSRLSFSTKDALKLAKIMYNGQPKLYLERKKLRFDSFKARTAQVSHV